MDDPSSGDQSVDPDVLEIDGKQFAHHAVSCDSAGEYKMAVFYYNVRYTLPVLSQWL